MQPEDQLEGVYPPPVSEPEAVIAGIVQELDPVPASPVVAPKPKQEYTAMRSVNGVPAGYKCGRCGLENLAHGEPHIDAAGVVCEPQTDPDGVPADHPFASRPDPKHLSVPHGAHGHIGFVDLHHIAHAIAELIRRVHPTKRSELFAKLQNDKSIRSNE